ncbi:MAG TPA: YceI family protein [Candidatus Sulfotelmatobacter sp.]|jgi:polyisoprenoid-binding protein YceI|nr:YceI family protein [Candidatus Sulfotelmatobacter sp.]
MATGAASANARYVVDAQKSQFTVQAFANGLISSVAHSPKIAIREWTGTVELAPDGLENALLSIHVNPASLEVLDEMRDSDRRELHRVMNKEVLETTQYPEVIYESSEVKAEKLRDDLYRLSVRGMLSLHGVSNEQELVAQVALGVESARAYGAFTLLQSDYNIRIASIAGVSLKLQDELKFSFYAVARKSE